jgi:hypothetical protein
MRGFIEELRDRNVFRITITYIVAGWLVAQATNLVELVRSQGVEPREPLKMPYRCKT